MKNDHNESNDWNYIASRLSAEESHQISILRAPIVVATPMLLCSAGFGVKTFFLSPDNFHSLNLICIVIKGGTGVETLFMSHYVTNFSFSSVVSKNDLHRLWYIFVRWGPFQIENICWPCKVLVIFSLKTSLAMVKKRQKERKLRILGLWTTGKWW